MYLRTTKRKNKNGDTIEYYQLAHNERHPETKKPVAKILHSFGRADDLDRDQLVRLCRSIARVCGVQVIDPLTELDGEMDLDDYGWPADLKLLRTLSFGTVLAIQSIWERIGIDKTIRTICRNTKNPVRYEKALLAMTANRLCSPTSKLGIWDRWLETVYMPSCNDLKLNHMYEAMDLLHDHYEKIEETIFFSVAEIFNLDVDLIFYDTTTASFSTDQADESSGRMFGRAKEGFWAPQVVIALAVTRDGLPVKSWVFPGNTADAKTVETIRKDLRGWNLSRSIFVADAGVNSEGNRAELARACGKYILASRMGSVSEIKQKVLAKRGPYKKIKDNLQCKEVIVGDGARQKRYILCYNPKEERKARKHREQVVKILEKELAKHPNKKATAAWAIELLASKRYGKYLSVSKSNTIKIDRAKIRDATRYDGKWVIETNDDTISIEDAALGYKSLMVIERCFRSLKQTQIKVTPMYHWLDRRIIAHVKICVLALLIERIAERECSKPWSNIKQDLDRLQASEFFSNKFQFFRRNEIPHNTRSILKSLKITAPKQVLSVVKHP